VRIARHAFARQERVRGSEACIQAQGLHNITGSDAPRLNVDKFQKHLRVLIYPVFDSTAGIGLGVPSVMKTAGAGNGGKGVNHGLHYINYDSLKLS
jgi:hypothetical protein